MTMITGIRQVLAADELSSWRDLALGSSQIDLAHDELRIQPVRLSDPAAWLTHQAARR